MMKIKTIRDISDTIKTGKTPPSKEEKYFDGNINWYTPGDLDQEKYLGTSKRTLTQLAFSDKKAVTHKSGTLLIGCIGDIGKLGITTNECSSNQQITGIFPKPDVDVNFLYYWFKFKKDVIVSTANNAVVPILNNKTLERIQIPLPPLSEQKRIAELLDAADTLRKKDKALLEKYDQLAQSLFLEMFGDPVKNEKGWDEVVFTDVLILSRGFDLPVQNRKVGHFPILASNGILDWHNEYKVKGPGVITGRSGTLGQVHYIERDYWPLNTALYSQDLKGNNPIYLLYLLKNFKVERFARGAGVPTLNRNLVHGEKIIYVPVNLQNQFAEEVQLIEQQKEIVKKNLEKSEELMKGLMVGVFG